MKENLFVTNKMKRLLSFILVIAMVIALMPLNNLTVYAESATPTPLTFTAEEVGATLSFEWRTGSNIQIKPSSTSIKIDSSNVVSTEWQNYTTGSVITLTNIGDSVSFKGENVQTGEVFGSSNKHFAINNGKIAASGDVTSLTNGVGGDALLSGEFEYQSMFCNCTSLTTAPNLPSITLKKGCYNAMFDGCISLKIAPVLPALNLANQCYQGMFANCTSLVEAPSLPATTLAANCYYMMFNNCTSLISAPTLIATALAESCYTYMFYGCKRLYVEETADEQLATWIIPDNNSYSDDWFYHMTTGTADFISESYNVRKGKKYSVKGVKGLITYDLNGGNFGWDANVKYYRLANNEYVLPSNIAVNKDNYCLEGWTLTNNDEDIDYITSISTSTPGDFKFYAKWAPIIQEEPSDENNYEVKVHDSIKEDAAYEWSKISINNLSSNEISIMNYEGVNYGTYNSETGVYSSVVVNIEENNYHFIALKSSCSSILFKCSSSNIYAEPSTFGDNYYILEGYLEEGVYTYSICDDSSFIVEDIYSYTSEAIEGQTSSVLSLPSLENCRYQCEVTYNNDTIYISSLFLPYAITFNANGGTGTQATIYQLKGRNVVLPSSSTFIAPTGKTFGGWASSFAGDILTNNLDFVSGDKTYYAVWTDIPSTPPHTHTGTKVNGQSATCTSDGWKDYYQCNDTECNKVFSDSECTSEITDLATWKSATGKIAATGHTEVTDAAVAATCTEKGKTEGKYCSVCNTVIADQETVEATGHEFSDEFTITKEATATTDGKKETTCKNGCGTKKVVVIPATGVKEEDPTNGKLSKDAEVAKDAPVESATLDNSKKNLMEASGIFTEAEKTAIANGDDAKVYLSIENLDESVIPAESKTNITTAAQNELGNNTTIKYMDVSLFKQIGNNPAEKVSEPGTTI